LLIVNRVSTQKLRLGHPVALQQKIVV